MLNAIIGAIVGSVLTIFLPKVIEIINKKISKNINNGILDISGKWVSVFVEDNNLVNEDVDIEQKGNIINAKLLCDKKTYHLEGEFSNNILVGKYKTNNKANDERGVIVLRRINEKLLNGYCTFIQNDRQIYNSSYILTRKFKQSEGTYAFCEKCKDAKECCCNNKLVDMPILLPFEAQKISEKSGHKIAEFADKIKNVYQMKREETGCFFYAHNKCSIHNYRPIDCRLFPFDLKENDGKFSIVCYNDKKICQYAPKDLEQQKEMLFYLKPLLDIISEYVVKYCDDDMAKSLKNQTVDTINFYSELYDDKIT